MYAQGKQAQLDAKTKKADELLNKDIPHSFKEFDERIEKLKGQHNEMKCKYNENLDIWKESLKIKREVGCHSFKPLSLLLFGICASFSQRPCVDHSSHSNFCVTSLLALPLPTSGTFCLQKRYGDKG